MQHINTRSISLIGTGMGSFNTMTQESLQALRQADIVFGAKRMLEVAKEQQCQAPCLCEYRAEQISDYLHRHPQYQNAAVLLSGDVGFFSGARQLVKLLRQSFDVRLYCGVSSVSYFAARLGIPWDDLRLCSRHGRTCNLLGELQRYGKVFTLLANGSQLGELARELAEYGMSDVQLAVARDLGMDSEHIHPFAPAKDYAGYAGEGLHVAILHYEGAKGFSPYREIPDEEFLRDRVPMTKREVRSISLSKLGLTEDSIVYDIGAGTGAMTVTCARIAYCGQVVAMEKNPAAIRLIRENCIRFRTPNVQILEGDALALMMHRRELPLPTHAFIGGSGGELTEILDWLLAANPAIEPVINTVTMESLNQVLQYSKAHGLEAEYTQVAISHAKPVGDYHLWQANNPVQVIKLGHAMRKGCSKCHLS